MDQYGKLTLAELKACMLGDKMHGDSLWRQKVEKSIQYLKEDIKDHAKTFANPP